MRSEKDTPSRHSDREADSPQSGTTLIGVGIVPIVPPSKASTEPHKSPAPTIVEPLNKLRTRAERLRDLPTDAAKRPSDVETVVVQVRGKRVAHVLSLRVPQAPALRPEEVATPPQPEALLATVPQAEVVPVQPLAPQPSEPEFDVDIDVVEGEDGALGGAQPVPQSLAESHLEEMPTQVFSRAELAHIGMPVVRDDALPTQVHPAQEETPKFATRVVNFFRGLTGRRS